MLLQNVICSSPVQSNEFSNLKFSYECAKYKDLTVGLVLTQAVKWLQKYFFFVILKGYFTLKLSFDMF